MDPGTTRFRVEEADHRLRLDRFVRKVRPDLSRSAVERMLRTGAVCVLGRPRDANYFVKQGDEVDLRDPPISVPAAKGEPIELLWSSHLVALGKPPGITTNPARQGEGSLLQWLASRTDQTPGIVHRLDRETSGLVLFSLSPFGYIQLNLAFRRAALRKTYLALVPGRLHPRQGTIDLPIRRDPQSGRIRPDPHGARARTDYITLNAGAPCSLLSITPRTGRMHQIRVHMAAIGHPIAGDPLYGDPRRTLGAPRLWLHAVSIDLPEELSLQLEAPSHFTCPLWADLVAHLQAVGIDPGVIPGTSLRSP